MCKYTNYIHTYIYQLRHVLSLQEDSTENLKKYGMVAMSIYCQYKSRSIG